MMWLNGIECWHDGCHRAISLDWPVGLLAPGWALRSDKRVAACPEHTDEMPPND